MPKLTILSNKQNFANLWVTGDLSDQQLVGNNAIFDFLLKITCKFYKQSRQSFWKLFTTSHHLTSNWREALLCYLFGSIYDAPASSVVTLLRLQCVGSILSILKARRAMINRVTHYWGELYIPFKIRNYNVHKIDKVITVQRRCPVR